MSALCKLEALTKRYTADEKAPVENVSLELNKGDFISIEGPSGTGKSTLLYMIGGMIRPTSGKIWFEQNDITALNDQALTAWRRDKIGFIFQETILFAALTAKENLTEALKLQKKTSRAQREQLAKEYLDLMGLSDRADYLPHQLSVGQRRRLIIARVLMSNPSLILADEPTNDLDDIWAEKIMELFVQKAKDGACVVMVTHNDKWAQKAFSRYTLDKSSLEKYSGQ